MIRKKDYKKIVTSEKWIEIIKKMKAYGLVYLSILGGEPTLYCGINQILECVEKNKIKTTITTNAINIPDNVFTTIVESDYITPSISIQSLNNETNFELMGVKASAIIKSIKKFINAKKTPRISIVYTKQSIEEIYELIDYCYDNNISDIFLNVFVSGNKKSNLKEHTFDDYRNINTLINKYLKKNQMYKSINFQIQGCLQYSAYYDYDFENLDKYNILKYGCEAGNTKIEIMPNGDVLPCVIFRNDDFDLNNVFKEDILYIWKKSKYLRMLRKFKCKDLRCKKCKFYIFCNGGCPAFKLKKYGNFEKKGDERCQILMSNHK